MPGRPTLSLVILCYQERDYIPRFVAEVKEALKTAGIPHTLILVANYWPRAESADISPRIVKELAMRDPSLAAVSLPKKGNMGWDLRSGFARATGDVVGFTDGDGQVAAGDVVRAYEMLVAGDFDMVLGQRRERRDGRLRKLTSAVYSLILRSFFPKVLARDINGKPKLFRRQTLERLKRSSDNWFADAELLIQASYRGFRIGFMPTVFYENTRRPSTTSPWSIVESLLDIVRYRIALWLRKSTLLA